MQYSLLDRRPEGEFAEICGGTGVGIFAYGTIAGGFLTERWLDVADPGFAFENRSLVKYRLIIEDFGGWGLFQELMQVLAGIARRHDASLAAVATRAMLDRSDVAAVIVGARYAHHLDQARQMDALRLDGEDRAAISSVLARARGPHGPVYGLERDVATPHGRILKKNLNEGPA
ncbi:MAG: aldo/keto reductase [Geminicoccaceae bacterium]